MVCPNCGKDIEEGEEFCGYCGQQIESAIKDITNVTEIIPKESVSITENDDNCRLDSHKQVSSRRLSKTLVAVICTLIVVTITVISMKMIVNKISLSHEIEAGDNCLRELDYEHAIESYTEAILIDAENEEAKEKIEEAYCRWIEDMIESGEISAALEKTDEGLRRLGNSERIEKNRERIYDLQKKAETQIVTDDSNSKSEDDTITEEITDESNNGKMLFSDIQIGQYVTIGNYEQDNDLDNGKEPIEWEVLDVDGDRALLISRYVLDCMPFNSDMGYASWEWEACSLRSWINDEFYNNAFEDNEKNVILSTELENLPNQYWHTPAGNNTEDKIFILSYQDIINYYQFESWDEENNLGSNRRLIIEATPYADSRGVDGYYISREMCEYWDYPVDLSGEKGAYWWLRTPGDSSGSFSCYVLPNGTASAFHEYFRVNGEGFGVRPAMWISISN